MRNITDYEDGTNLLLNENIEAQILSGNRRSYGAAFSVKKNKRTIHRLVQVYIGKKRKANRGDQ